MKDVTQEPSCNNPCVSVIVPNFNHGRYVEQRINSILNQTFTDFELIILDDASNDESIEIINKYANLPKVKIILNHENSGNTFKQWEKGIKIAIGEFIWIAESDDIAHPQLLEKLVLLLSQYQSMGIAYCQSVYIDEKDKVIGTHQESISKLDSKLWCRDFVMNGGRMLSNYMIVTNVIPNASAVVFRKKAYRDSGGADTTLRLCGDWMTWSKILVNNDIGYTALPLNYFRIHNNTVRGTMYYKMDYLSECLSVIKFIYKNSSILKWSKRKALHELRLRLIRICINGKWPINTYLKIIKEVKIYFGSYQAILLSFIGLFSSIASILGIAKCINYSVGKYSQG